ncbi:phosphatidylinositol 4-kinase gamma 4 [Phtheirospermum japonicum]|uniref:1-phosphatidylinositol 4-kinase n=1 Tax=Phtheirospermum japonicum TaxID=374723 RepID=A0A830CXI0_9LAMI|nr:phosphatidylinositol 4-kinase gamma 4 [Phtheirospermum japonicum]
MVRKNIEMSSTGLVSIASVPDESTSFSPPPLLELGQDSILIYLAISGSMVPMRVLKSDSIEAVRLRIQTCKGIFTRNQKLVCGGKELSRSNSLLEDYDVSNGNVLHLVLRLADLQVINVRTCCGKEFTFNVEANRDFGYVKRQIAKKRNSETIDDEEVLFNGEAVEDKILLSDISKNNDNATIHLFVRKNAKIRASPVGKNFELSIESPPQQTHKKGTRNLLEPLIVNPKIELPLEITDMINSTLDGLNKGNYPIRSSEGTGGTYFMLDASSNKYVSVFKPSDEEPMAVNNPRGLPVSKDGEGLKRGTRVGEGGVRECAVYLLDHPRNGRRSFSGGIRGFAGVPPTVYVRCLHEGFNYPGGGGVGFKSGSLQMFVENSGSCEDVGPGVFPVDEVHKIAVLDMRVANADRHAGNILVSRGADGRIVLVPIDHGYCLPSSFEDCTFDWLYWPQAHRPFSTDTVNYIKSMDAEEDIALLRFYGWDPPVECARVLRISTMLLKKGVEKGLTPFAIGSMMCRETVKKQSVIEEIVREAWDSVLPGSSESAFLDSVSSIMDRRIEEIA